MSTAIAIKGYGPEGTSQEVTVTFAAVAPTALLFRLKQVAEGLMSSPDDTSSQEMAKKTVLSVSTDARQCCIRVVAFVPEAMTAEALQAALLSCVEVA